MAETRIDVDAERAGGTIAALVREALGCPWSRARDLVRSGRVRVDGQREIDPASRVVAGVTVLIQPEARRQRRGVLDPDRVIHLDSEVIVVRKPVGALTVPWDEEDKDTLVDQVRAFCAQQAGRRRKGGAARDAFVGVVQRLDKNTSGALVFARTMSAKRALESQFRDHSVHRRYVGIAHGVISSGATWTTHLMRDRGDGLRGSWGSFRRAGGPPPREAKRSVTHARPLEALRASTLVECRLETGRQHQIRIHLAEAGHPLVGEEVYIRDFEGPRIAAPRVMLHARELGFVHPRSGEEVRFTDPPPADFEACLKRLRG